MTPPRDPEHDTDGLMLRVYDELRGLAADQLRNERAGHTLQPTALVHEAYMRLAELERTEWRDKTHFLVAAAGTIRRVLIDHARARATGKRGGGAKRVTLGAVDETGAALDVDILALEEALEQLAALHERKARVVELRWFGGLTIEQTAKALGIGTTTVEDDWAFARAWLGNQLEQA